MNGARCGCGCLRLCGASGAAASQNDGEVGMASVDKNLIVSFYCEATVW